MVCFLQCVYVETIRKHLTAEVLLLTFYKWSLRRIVLYTFSYIHTHNLVEIPHFLSMETILEQQRRYHEERERLVKLMVDEYVTKKPSVSFICVYLFFWEYKRATPAAGRSRKLSTEHIH